jgi:hypothetical protein
LLWLWDGHKFGIQRKGLPFETGATGLVKGELREKNQYVL